MKDYWKIGFHTGPAGDATGIGDYFRELDAVGKPFSIKSVDDYGFIKEALAYSNADHAMVFRMVTRDGINLDVPFYDIEDWNDAAAEHWALLESYLPFEYKNSADAKRRVWLEFINEPDKNRADWLGKYCTAFARLANADGYKVLAFSWSPGEPEPEDWSLPGMQEYLRYCAQNKDKAGVALHEYSLTSENLDRWYPHLLGRYQQMFDECDRLGIQRPIVYISEFGWTLNNMPNTTEGMADLNWAQNEVYKNQPDVIGTAIWYLGACAGWNGICHKTQRLIAPVKRAAIAYPNEEIAPGPTPPNNPSIVNSGFSEGFTVVDFENEVPTGWQMAWYGMGQTLPNESVVTRIPTAVHEAGAYTVAGDGIWGLVLVPTINNLLSMSEYEIGVKVTVDYKTPDAPQDRYDITFDLAVGEERYGVGSDILLDNQQAVIKLRGSTNKLGNLGVLLQVYSKLMNNRKIYIDDVTIEYIGDAPVVVEPDPCEDCVRKGDAREPYNRTYYRVNESATLDQFLQIAEIAYATKSTIGFSADDAGIGVGLGTKTVNEVGGQYNADAIEDWYREWYDVDVVNHIGYGTTPPVVPPPTGVSDVKFGIHTSADSRLMTNDMTMLTAIKPDVIKLLSGFPQSDVVKVVNKFPKATYIVRAFLSFGGRKVTPAQFYEWTISDVVRTVDTLVANGVGKDRLLLELHNEPNLVDEGLSASWANGREFGVWLADVAVRYRQALGSKVQLLYPGLSPGETIPSIRQDSKVFFTESKSALVSVDAVGVHGYWSPAYDMMNHPHAIIQTVNWYNANAGGKALHITESSNNSGNVGYEQKAAEYVAVWNVLKTKPNIKTLCFFVLSASNPAWGTNGSKETWTQAMCSTVGARR